MAIINPSLWMCAVHQQKLLGRIRNELKLTNVYKQNLNSARGAIVC